MKKKTKNALEYNSDNLLSILLQRGSDIVIVIKNNDVIECNINAEFYFQCPKQEILNTSYSQLCTKLGKENLLHVAAQHITAHIDTDKIEWNIVTFSNSIETYPIYVLIGKTAHQLGIPIDDHNLQEHLNTWSNYIPGNIYWKSMDGIYHGCNEEFLNSFGFESKNSFLGKTDHDLWGEDASRLIAHDQMVIQSRRPHYFEETVSLSSGIKQYFTVLKAPLINDSGRMIGIINNALSISEIKNALIKLTQEKEKIETENKTISQYLQDIISAVPGSIYWKNKNGVYLGCNEFMARTAGLTPSEIIGKTDYELWPSQAEELCKNDKRVMELGESIRIEEEVTLTNNKKRYFIVDKMPLRDPDGNLNGIIGNSMEITDIKETQAALESANSAKTEFIANMSHDIRTPLTGVIGMSKIMEDKTNDAEEKQYAHWVNESGKQLLSLLNGILDVISAENVNDNDLLNETFDLYRSIQDIAELETPTIKLKKLDLIINISENVPQYLVSDPTKLHRILLNLVGNSIKFTEKGYISIDVELLERLEDSVRLRFNVIDTGIGIPEELQSKVFDRFFRVNPSYKGVYKGHGIGLHIAQSYVELLGGEIKLVSQVNQGTTFYFDLLLKIGRAEDIKHDESNIIKDTEEKTTNTSSNNPPITDQSIAATSDTPYLLLIEDSPIALKMLQIAATNAGCRYESAENALSALELIKTNAFDLIVTDIGLPDMCGMELTRAIREWEAHSHSKKIPIIGLTAHTVGTETKKCLQAGMDKILIKPATFKLIQSIVDEFIKSKKITTSDTSNEKNREIEKNTDLPANEELLKLSEFPLFDLERGINILGNEALLKDMITLMLHHGIDEDRIKITRAYAQKDWNKIQSLAHKMKGGATYCGMIRLKVACEYLERYQKNGHANLLEELYAQLIQSIDMTKEYVSDWLKKQ